MLISVVPETYSGTFSILPLDYKTSYFFEVTPILIYNISKFQAVATIRENRGKSTHKSSLPQKLFLVENPRNHVEFYISSLNKLV